MSLTEARFHDLVDATQQALEDIFDESDLDLDLENSAGVLTVKFENGTQLIFSRQEPLRQLWLAARSGGFHFDYDEETSRWVCDSSDELLSEMLVRITQEQAGVELDFAITLRPHLPGHPNRCSATSALPCLRPVSACVGSTSRKFVWAAFAMWKTFANGARLMMIDAVRFAATPTSAGRLPRKTASRANALSGCVFIG
ncbi:Protein CyaY [Pseudomonas cichorii]|uniref:Iron-sulfur cluster assembly protein CyaY n=1 Tax=Pseudomonas cichorii TaxID=36746 RepID=A0A3M4W0H7_PSECI|nr:Protein CyaY [Pseudomonas cichorii]